MNTMTFKYRFAKLGVDHRLLEEVSCTMATIHHSVKKIDLQAAGISEYNQRYISNKLKHPSFDWSINCYMLSWLLSHLAIPREKSVLVDYGGGSGFTSFLAKALGIGTVIYLDVYDVSCGDAEKLGKLIGLGADHYIHGELPDLLAYLSDVRLSCDVFASHDCIEHVYDIESFMRGLREIPSRHLAVWLSSSANALRKKTRRTLMKAQMKSEYESRNCEWGHKERDSLRSFLSVRKKMVRGGAPSLGTHDVEVLAQRTRGMRQDDILGVAREYMRSGRLPESPKHLTNTCDPYTGNWCEQLMDPFWLCRILQDAGFTANVMPGYWDPGGKPKWKAFLKDIVNFSISILGPRGLRFAPYYILCGMVPKETREASLPIGRCGLKRISNPRGQ